MRSPLLVLAFLIFLIDFALVGSFLWFSQERHQARHLYAPPPQSYWDFQSIDTMKYSRDLAREKGHDAGFDQTIETQVRQIAETGATHVAIATPYDEEFVPFLERWVAAARRHDLGVWFRGNWSGWEGWFDYPRLSREEHLAKTEAFIGAHPELFADGDAFSSCPECENGGPGDPRQAGDAAGYRQFLIAEREMLDRSFRQIGKKVRTDLFSMNGDVARLIMDAETTKRLGGTVTIDHYVKAPEQLASDVRALAEQSGGKVVLGEMGAPIPDIHGTLSRDEQAEWLDAALGLLKEVAALEGVNYWVSSGGSTELWNAAHEPFPAARILGEHFRPGRVYGFVEDELGRPIARARVSHGTQAVETDEHGHFELAFPNDHATLPLRVVKAGYQESTEAIAAGPQELDAVLVKQDRDWIFKLLLYWRGNAK